jgi:replicative superfamily II helicase
MVDFNKLRQQRTRITPINPTDIFLRLPRSPGIDDLWNSQAEALKAWFERRNEKDIVIKMNTGGGKTLVGLLIAQSIINEHHGPVLYLSPTVQLVEQTLGLARKYGIQAVRYERGQDLDEKFLSGQSVMVATYAALFNGLSRFGISGGTREIVRLEALILDDAHTAFSDMRDVFTISIDRNTRQSLYAQLTHLFRTAFDQLGRQGTFDDVVSGREQAVLEVPYWSWLSKCSEVREQLAKLAQEDDFVFSWPLLRDYFPLCHALISSWDFSITPMYPVVDMFPSFADCPRRVYMSATVADDSSIVRTFDASRDSVSKPIAPTSLAGVGERMILAPELMMISKKNLAGVIEKLVHWVSKAAGVVILTPSKRAAAQWTQMATLADGDDVAKRIQELVSRASNGPFVFPNRYDGIDLPGDSCRLLVISGLPKGSNSYDLYRATVFEGSSAINTTIAQRVEQGMGRATRGAGDHCVVVLTGRELIAWISRSSNINLLTATTKSQLKLGIDISRNIGSLKELAEAIKKCLERKEDWTEYHAEVVADSVATPSVNIQNLAAAACERKFFRLARDGYYEKAVGTAVKFVEDNIDLDEKLKGWLLQLAAHIAFLGGNQDKADQLQQNAYALNRRSLLRPRVSPPYVRLSPPSKQSENIVSQLRSFEFRRGFLAYFEEVADWLIPEASSNQFEESLKNLGTILGFEAHRPECEFGRGPDDLWILDDRSAMVIEVKSRKDKDNPLTKEDHGQLLEAYEWFRQNYPGIKGYKVVVHPNAVTTRAVTAGDSFALTLQTLTVLLTNTRELITQLCEITADSTLRAGCEKLLSGLNLTPTKLVSKFLESFHNA